MNQLPWCYCKTWYRLILHLYEPAVLSKRYILALSKKLFNLRVPRNETMGYGVKVFFTSLSIYKILRFLSIIAIRDFSKGWYVTTNANLFILLFLSLLLHLKLEILTFLISGLIRSSGYSLFLNHDFISSLRFSKSFSNCITY